MFDSDVDADNAARQFYYPSVNGQKPEPFEINPVYLYLLEDLG